jgi:hypothetical protein
VSILSSVECAAATVTYNSDAKGRNFDSAFEKAIPGEIRTLIAGVAAWATPKPDTINEFITLYDSPSIIADRASITDSAKYLKSLDFAISVS